MDVLSNVPCVILPGAGDADRSVVYRQPHVLDSLPEFICPLPPPHGGDGSAAPHGRVLFGPGDVCDDGRQEVEVVVNAGGGVEGRLLDVGGRIANAAAVGEDLVALVAWQRAVPGGASRAFVLWRVRVAVRRLSAGLRGLGSDVPGAAKRT
jgi:hypothetical protein